MFVRQHMVAALQHRLLLAGRKTYKDLEIFFEFSKGGPRGEDCHQVSDSARSRHAFMFFPSFGLHKQAFQTKFLVA